MVRNRLIVLAVVWLIALLVCFVDTMAKAQDLFDESIEELRCKEQCEPNQFYDSEEKPLNHWRDLIPVDDYDDEDDPTFA